MHARLRHARLLHSLRLCTRSLVLPLLLLLVVPALGQAQTTNRAGLVIVKGDGSVQTACVAFDEPTISGLALLERSGYDVALQPAGSNATVCSIAGEGCAFPQEACWCQCAGGGQCRYWSYWHRNGGIWQYAATGAPLYRVPPNGVDAWVWGESSGTSSVRPPEIDLNAICEVPAPEPTLVLIPPTEVPVPTDIPAPPTDVPVPTALPATATQPPVVQPTATQSRPTPTQPPPTQTADPQSEATTVPATPTKTLAPTSTLPPSAAPATVTQIPAGAAVVDTPTVTTTQVAPTNTAQPLPTATVESTTPAPTPTQQPAVVKTSNTASYILFGGTACLLLMGLGLAWRRRR